MTGSKKYRATFTVADVVVKVREIAAAYYHRVYQRPSNEPQITGCLYVHHDGGPAETLTLTPGCIIGQALHALGVPLEFLTECEGMLVSGVLNRLGVEIYSTQEVRRDTEWLERVQSYQDQGIEWGTAVIYTDEDLRED